MSDVNPMLAPSDLRSDREKVTALFGQVSEVVLKAVGEFLEKNPGALDHHNLRLIASAAPHIDDPKLVAELIDRLPITKMHIGLRPIDIDAARADLQRVLPHYSPRTRVNLVSDLVHKTAVDTLTFSPPERLTREARQFVASHLMNLAGGDRDDQTRAVASEYATSEWIDAVLDRIEQRIIRSEHGSAVRAPGKLPLELVSDPLCEIVRGQAHNDNVMTAQLERTWSLVRRCEPDARSMFRLLTNVISNPKLSEPLAHLVLDDVRALGRLEGFSDLSAEYFGRFMRAVMISVPEMPESAVHRAVYEGVEMGALTSSGETVIVDPRFYLYRKHSYAVGQQSESPVPSGFEGPDVQTSESRAGDRSTNGPTSAEVDRWLASRPIDELTEDPIGVQVIKSMTDPEALMTLSRRDKTSPEMIKALRLNPHTPKEVFSSVFEKTGLLGRTPSFSRLFTRVVGAADRLMPFDIRRARLAMLRERQAIHDYRLADEDLATILRERHTERHLLADVVRNRSAGPRVLEVLLELAPTKSLLAEFAVNSSDRQVHAMLEQHVLALESESDDVVDKTQRDRLCNDIRQGLADNGTVSDTLFQGTLRRNSHMLCFYGSGEFVDVEPSYTPDDVALRMIDDGDASGAHLDAMVRMATSATTNQNQVVDARHALVMLADAGILPSESWRALTRCADTHVAMMFATHPNCTSSLSDAKTSAHIRISETAEALDAGVQLPGGRVRSWSDLPNKRVVRFDLPPALELIDGQTVAGLKLELIRTPQELEDAARYMGNCLSGYEVRAREGRVVIATAQDGPDERLAVALNVVRRGDRPLLEIHQINSRFNRDNVSDDFRSEVQQLVDKLASGDLEPPQNETPIELEAVIAEAEPVAPSPVNAASETFDRDQPAPRVAPELERAAPRDRQRVVRRGRRLELNVAPAENRAAPHDQPSLLTNQAPETEAQQLDPVTGLDSSSVDQQITDLPPTDEPTLDL